ncbi:paraquat-inducible membrane protein A [Saccharobesus litoralis]|uniref:Paraquat-inducible membrane protein A n=1 Tax=Saccharobesus litoralis TaxID=2172099 RepID=A0A2S0VNZ5_9ALTE|nr:paraquat-inducible protein A [Saccharobesus litoralis]AWB65941.1 paraquat-inducible membrane protein A [Saccharobesus litoralis]
MKTALEQDIAVCRVCGFLNALEHRHCQRCYATLYARKPDSLQRTIAWLMTAILLYFPANFLPIMHTRQFSQHYSTTIVGGVVDLWGQGSYLVASVIFAASIVIPIIKILVLIWLVLSTHYYHVRHQRQRTLMYRMTEVIGRWSMIDVFVVAILVALFQLGGVLTIMPGIAALAFAGVVITTMLAAQAFDSRLIWDQATELEDFYGGDSVHSSPDNNSI